MCDVDSRGQSLEHLPDGSETLQTVLQVQSVRDGRAFEERKEPGTVGHCAEAPSSYRRPVHIYLNENCTVPEVSWTGPLSKID